MNNIKIQDEVLKYLTNLQCLNNKCRHNIDNAFCNLKNIVLNGDGECFNFDKKEDK